MLKPSSWDTWRFIGGGSAARCDVCERQDLYLFHWRTIYRCVNHLGPGVRREAMKRG